MNIVILDGHTLNPGDLSWAGLEAIGPCAVYDNTPAELVVERAADCQMAIVNKVIVNRDVISALPKLQYIGVTATGYNVVDLAAARARNIPVTNVPTYGTPAVAQMVFAHILELTQHVAYHAQTVVDGRWTASEHFCYWDYPMIELTGLTMGIVGFGRIGKATANLAKAFGMKVLAHELFAEARTDPDVQYVDMDTLFRESDVVSLHCPLTDETKGFINKDRLALMKESAILVNTSRGPLINESDLAEALNNGRIAGAGLDVLAVEPPPADHPLYHARNCNITPHIAWATRAARSRLMDVVVDNAKAYLAGTPQNVVN